MGDTLNITSNFLYCNHQVHRDFLITLYIVNVAKHSTHIIYHIIQHVYGEARVTRMRFLFRINNFKQK